MRTTKVFAATLALTAAGMGCEGAVETPPATGVDGHMAGVQFNWTAGGRIIGGVRADSAVADLSTGEAHFYELDVELQAGSAMRCWWRFIADSARLSPAERFTLFNATSDSAPDWLSEATSWRLTNDPDPDAEDGSITVMPDGEWRRQGQRIGEDGCDDSR